MNLRTTFTTALILFTLSTLHLGMSRRGQYDEEARQAEREAKQMRELEEDSPRKNPAKQFAGGVKEATYDSATGLIGETTQGAAEDEHVTGTLEGARRGTGTVLDKTVKGVSKVATLGYGEVNNYEVEEPESGTDEPTKIKIKIPGT